MDIRLISFSGAAFIHMLGRTLRVQWFDEQYVSEARGTTRGGVIYAFWHQRLLPFCFTHRNRGIRVLISTHRDGEIIARTIERLGFGTVRGSSTRGGREALFGLINESRKGFDLAVTPDGPRGPRYFLKPGLVTVARKTGFPIIPIANSVWPRKELSSWDGFHIPLPFAKCIITHGKPVFVPQHGDREEIRRDLEDRVMDVTRRADSLLGRAHDEK
jgi:lysophospholipid acyltransferase (LPLAT)-like uncharacterized protein